MSMGLHRFTWLPLPKPGCTTAELCPKGISDAPTELHWL